jgi:multiple sugar transport system permease protein
MTTQSATLTSEIASPKARQRTLEQQQRMWGWVFLSPWLFGFLVFTALPIVASFLFTLTSFKIGQDMTFVGLSNWHKLFTDPLTLESLGVTIRFGLISLPVSLGFPLLLATLLTSKILIGKPFFRLFFYMPYIVPAISSIFVWRAFLNGQTGWLDRILRLIGIANPPDWLFDTPYLNTGLIMLSLWGVGNAMLTMMAAMQGVPTELYEAAKVDGASRFQAWLNVTLPLITPVIFYNLVLTVIGLMQYFVPAFVLSNTLRSNPATNFINLFLYRTAFEYNDLAYAATLAWLIFIVALAMTIALFATSRRWVYYTSGE